VSRICNFPISKSKRCKQPVADGKPDCGRHKIFATHSDATVEQTATASPVREGGVKVATGSNYKKVRQLDR
jgi:hypothetical protein